MQYEHSSFRRRLRLPDRRDKGWPTDRGPDTHLQPDLLRLCRYYYSIATPLRSDLMMLRIVSDLYIQQSFEIDSVQHRPNSMQLHPTASEGGMAKG